MTNEQALLTIADALEAAAKIARRAVAAADSAEHAEAAGEVERMLNRARKVHPQLGPRQVRGLEQLPRVWPFPAPLKRSGGLQAGEVPAEISFLMLGLLEQMAVHHGVVIGGHAA